MAQSYSQDLRDGGLSRREAVRRFGICYSTAIRWLDAVTRSGRRHAAGKGGPRPLKLAPERTWLLAKIDRHPDLTLEALAVCLQQERGVSASASMLSRFFGREGISFKKTYSPASRTELILPIAASSGRRIRSGHRLNASFSLMRPGPRPI